MELRVKVSGEPEPKIVWLLNGKKLTSSLRYKMEQKKDVHILSSTQVIVSMTGVYQFVATNSNGTVEHQATITITGLYSRILLVFCF